MAGPAVLLSFIFAGFTSIFAALSYCELASIIPIAGSTYTYAYVTIGEIIGKSFFLLMTSICYLFIVH